MGVSRNPDGTLNISKCLSYCQTKSTKKCGKGCRNKKSLSNINSDIFFSSILINEYVDIKGTEEFYKEKVESILKNIY